jgi:hypothetical protein
MRYVMVLIRVLMPDSLRFDMCGCDSISAAKMYVPSLPEIQVAWMMSEV